MGKSILVVFVSVLVVIAAGFFFLSGVEGSPEFCSFNETFDCLAFAMTFTAPDTDLGSITFRMKNTLDEDIFLSRCSVYVEDSYVCRDHYNTTTSSHFYGANYTGASLAYCDGSRWNSGEYRYLKLDKCDFSEPGFVEGDLHEVVIELDYFLVDDLGEDVVGSITSLDEMWHADALTRDINRSYAYEYLIAEGLMSDAVRFGVHRDNTLDTEINETLHTSRGKVVARLVPGR